MLQTSAGVIPVMIEAKGTKGKLVKFNNSEIDNTKPANVKNYAVNGAVHYGLALKDTSYKTVLCIGINGYEENDSLTTEFEIYVLSEKNFWIPKKLEAKNLSFLSSTHEKLLLDRIATINLSELEVAQILESRKNATINALQKVNQLMHDNLNIAPKDRVTLITALLIVAKGDTKNDNKIYPLHLSDLKSEISEDGHDGVIVHRKLSSIIKNVCCMQDVDKQKLIGSFNQVLLYSDLYTIVDGESKIKTVFREVSQHILTNIADIDVMGPVFNKLLSYVEVPDGDKNDVVLTPDTVTHLMADLANIKSDSIVLDPCAGTGAFFNPAIRIMKKAIDEIEDDKEKQNALQKLEYSSIYGIELRPDIWQLCAAAALMMDIDAGNIINGDCTKVSISQTPTVLLANPPYSVDGKGFCLLEPWLAKMKSGGRGVIIIQENAGAGQGVTWAKRILTHSSLIASIKMPGDLFIGKAGVQTAIYIFETGKPHDPEKLVKFVDFSNDGYVRSNRKKSSQEINLRDDGTVKARLKELEAIVNDKKRETKHLDVITDTITLEGNDWTYAQHKVVDTKASENDFVQMSGNFLEFQVSSILKSSGLDDSQLTEEEKAILKEEKEKKEFKIEELFNVESSKKIFHANNVVIKNHQEKDFYPYVVRSVQNNGVVGYINEKKEYLNPKNTLSFAQDTFVVFYQNQDYFTGNKVKILNPKIKFNQNIGLFIASVFNILLKNYSWGVGSTTETIKNYKIQLPITSTGEIDFDYMEKYVSVIMKTKIKNVVLEINKKLELYKQTQN